MNSRFSKLKNPMSVRAVADEFGIPEACTAELARCGEVESDLFFAGHSDRSVLLVERDDIVKFRMDGRNDERT